MRINRSQLGVILVVVGMMAMAAGGAVAATPTADTSDDADSSSTSDITDGANITAFSANASNNTVVQFNNGTADSKLVVYDDKDQVVYTNTSAEAVNASATDPEYKFNVSHDEWDDLPVDSGGNNTFTFQIVNDSTVDEPDKTNLTVYVEGAEGRTVRFLGAQVADDDDLMTIDTDGFDIPLTDSTLFGDEFAKYEEDDVPINGSDSTVTLHYADTDAADALSTATDGLSDEAWASGVIVLVDGEPTRAYIDSAPSDADGTYAVIDTDENDLTVHTGDGYEDEDNLDLTVNTNKGWWAQFSAYGFEAVGVPVDFNPVQSLAGMMGMFGGGLLTLSGFALIASRPEPEV